MGANAPTALFQPNNITALKRSQSKILLFSKRIFGSCKDRKNEKL